jgi:2-amino-4-hydroxy-6-hydroxymethyldihydropteridine diphosphokinase
VRAAPQREPVTAFIGLGANLGDARRAVRSAIDAIGRLPGTTVTRASSLYRSAPLEAGGPDYVNAVVAVETRLGATELLAQLQRIELEAGRTRPYRNAPRTLDLDLLLFGEATVSSARLELPHPRLLERAFVLLPLAQIAPERVPATALAAVRSQVIARLPPDTGD